MYVHLLERSNLLIHDALVSAQDIKRVAVASFTVLLLFCTLLLSSTNLLGFQQEVFTAQALS